MSVHAAPVTASTLVVAVDVGKSSAAVSVTDAGRHRLMGPVEFTLTRPTLLRVVDQVRAVLPEVVGVSVKVGVPPHHDARLGRGAGRQPSCCAEDVLNTDHGGAAGPVVEGEWGGDDVEGASLRLVEPRP